jgi:phosphate-selective porin
VRALLSSAVLLLTWRAASADPVVTDVRIGGYVQPQVRLKQNDPQAPFDEDGFRLRRARLLLGGRFDPDCGFDVRVRVEAEATPEFQLLDAYVEATGELPAHGAWRLAVGQVKAPFSRQTLVSDANLQMVEKAGLVELAPDRQLGVTGTLLVPALRWVELSAGLFNGEGRNLIDNSDENFMVVGRVAVRPIGARAPLVESALGEDQLSVAASAFHDVRDVGDYDETVLGLGADAFVSWNGLSATVEYLWRETTFPDAAPRVDFVSEGINVQAGWLLPLPGWAYRRLEIQGRFEELDRNDAIPIENPGYENQSTRSYAVGLGWYQRGHALKVQLTAAHVEEVEDIDRQGDDATYDNDYLLVQVTARLE